MVGCQWTRVPNTHGMHAMHMASALYTYHCYLYRSDDSHKWFSASHYLICQLLICLVKVVKLTTMQTLYFLYHCHDKTVHGETVSNVLLSHSVTVAHCTFQHSNFENKVLDPLEYTYDALIAKYWTKNKRRLLKQQRPTSNTVCTASGCMCIVGVQVCDHTGLL